LTTLVESANAGLKGAFADLSRGFFRVFGRVKISVLLGFTIAAYNLGYLPTSGTHWGWLPLPSRLKKDMESDECGTLPMAQ
jgi:hypothetical protein